MLISAFRNNASAKLDDVATASGELVFWMTTMIGIKLCM